MLRRRKCFVKRHPGYISSFCYQRQCHRDLQYQINTGDIQMAWREDVKEKLKDFPNSFQLEEFVYPRRRRYVAVVKNCTEEIFDTRFEEIRNENFLTLLHFKLDDTDEALKMNTKALTKDPENLVALANQVYLMKYTQREVEADTALGKLEMMRENADFERRRDQAVGELAYSYSRMGPKYYHKAIKLFKDVTKRRPGEYLLKFGLALVCKRCLTQCIFSMEPTEDVGQTVALAVQSLHDVIQNSTFNNLKGKSYILLGELYKLLDDCIYPVNSVIVSSLDIVRISDVQDCYKEAYNIASQNWFVLERAGKYFRKLGTYSSAEILLKGAIKIRPNSTHAEHQMGLVYKDMAMQKFQGSLNNDNLSIAGCIGGDTQFPEISSQLEHISTTTVNPGSAYGDLMAEAISHLELSLKICNGSNTRAMYDLAMIYVILDKKEEAETLFRKLVEQEQPFSSPLEKANAFEQLGLLYRKLSENKQLENTRQAYFRTQCKIMFTKSIEQAAKAVVNVPGKETSQMLDKLKSLPTLEDLFLSEYQETKQVQGIKEVARLRTLMGRHKSSLDLYRALSGGGACDEGVMEGMIDSYLKLEDYENAHLTLSIMQSAQTRHHGKGRYEFDKNVLLTCGMHFLQGGQLGKARECFTGCFKIAYPATRFEFDIFLLDDVEDAETGTVALEEALERCGLKVTRNDEAVTEGSLGPEKQADIMNDCRAIIIVLSNDRLSRRFAYFCNIATELLNGRTGPGTIIVVTETAEVPLYLKGFKSVQYKRLAEGPRLSCGDMDWLRGLFNTLLDHKIRS